MRVTVKWLEDVAFFLNNVTPNMTADDWEKFCKGAKKRKLFSTTFWSPAFFERVTREEAMSLRSQVAHDLSYGDKNPEAWFASLLGTLNSLELKTVYQCPPVRLYGKPRPGQVILKAGKNRFVPLVYPEATRTRQLLYVGLGAALMDGILDRLKKCIQCRRWSVGKAGRKFCSSACKDAFHYDSRIKSGYFKDYQREKRTAENEAAAKSHE